MELVFGFVSGRPKKTIVLHPEDKEKPGTLGAATKPRSRCRRAPQSCLGHITRLGVRGEKPGRDSADMRSSACLRFMPRPRSGFATHVQRRPARRIADIRNGCPGHPADSRSADPVLGSAVVNWFLATLPAFHGQWRVQTLASAVTYQQGDPSQTLNLALYPVLSAWPGVHDGA